MVDRVFCGGSFAMYSPPCVPIAQPCALLAQFLIVTEQRKSFASMLRGINASNPVQALIMRVHLQDRTNRLYYTGEDRPLGESDRAMNFASVGAAARLALGSQLTEMHIIVRYDVVACEISLPVLAEWSDFDRSHPSGPKGC
jgi:hypothetical protein